MSRYSLEAAKVTEKAIMDISLSECGLKTPFLSVSGSRHARKKGVWFNFNIQTHPVLGAAHLRALRAGFVLVGPVEK